MKTRIICFLVFTLSLLPGLAWAENAGEPEKNEVQDAEVSEADTDDREEAGDIDAFNVDVFGEIQLGIRAVSDKYNSARFEEYRDLDDGVYGDAVLRAFKGGYYLNITAENIGRDDQSYLLKGGRFSIPFAAEKGATTTQLTESEWRGIVCAVPCN